MTKILWLLLLLPIAGVWSFTKNNKSNDSPEYIGDGSVPAVAGGKNNVLHLTYGRGDSVLYAVSTNGGRSFSNPEVVGVVPKLFSFAMRGPKIASTGNGVCIVAANQQGHLFSFRKDGSAPWKKGPRVNDRDTVAKEGLLALDGNGNGELFAVWLDIRLENRNNIFGARSTDGGKTWSANRLLYQSPDGHTCECCKPSVAVQGNEVVVMFRNWLDGNRNLYLLRSTDKGQTFLPAQKLGVGNWKLNGCPMDGGGLALAKNGVPKTVWRREGTIYAAEPGAAEKEIGQGRGCTLETVNGKTVYAWVEKGDVVVLLPNGEKQNLGKGSLPVLQAAGNDAAVCIWEKDKKIYKTLLTL